MKNLIRHRPPVPAALSGLALVFAGGALLTHAIWRNRRRDARLPPPSSFPPSTRSLSFWLRHDREQKLSKRHPQLHMDEAVVLYAKPQELFIYWKDLRALPELLPAIQSIAPLASNRHRWTMVAPNCQTLEWETEIVRLENQHLISWQSTADSPVNNRGSLQFTPLGDGRTQLRVILQFQHTGSPQSRLLASTISGTTCKALRASLHHFKEGALELAPARSPKQEDL